MKHPRFHASHWRRILLNQADLFVTEERLREAYEQPDASLPDFLKHILNVARLPSREEQISRAFDSLVAKNPSLNATQLMFIRTLRQVVLSRARIATVDELLQPPFSRIGDARQLFTPSQLDELLDLAQSLAA